METVEKNVFKNHPQGKRKEWTQQKCPVKLWLFT